MDFVIYQGKSDITKHSGSAEWGDQMESLNQSSVIISQFKAHGFRSWLSHSSEPPSFTLCVQQQLYVLMIYSVWGQRTLLRLAVGHFGDIDFWRIQSWWLGKLDLWRLNWFVCVAGGAGRRVTWGQSCSYRRHLQMEKNGALLHICSSWLEGVRNSRSETEYKQMSAGDESSFFFFLIKGSECLAFF